MVLLSLIILSAKWEKAKIEGDQGESQKMLNGFLALVVFVGIWFMCCVFACSKFLIGYMVGVWYFTT